MKCEKGLKYQMVTISCPNTQHYVAREEVVTRSSMSDEQQRKDYFYKSNNNNNNNKPTPEKQVKVE
jgi:hypothetical protein